MINLVVHVDNEFITDSIDIFEKDKRLCRSNVFDYIGTKYVLN